MRAIPGRDRIEARMIRPRGVVAVLAFIVGGCGGRTMPYGSGETLNGVGGVGSVDSSGGGFGAGEGGLGGFGVGGATFGECSPGEIRPAILLCQQPVFDECIAGGIWLPGTCYQPACREGEVVSLGACRLNGLTPEDFCLNGVWMQRPCVGDSIVRVSVSSNGNEGDDGSLSQIAISSTGEVVAFASESSNLVSEDNNGVSDIFLHYLTRGETIRISVNAQGVEADGASFQPSLDGDGKLVAFSSVAKNLDEPFTSSARQIFLYDADNQSLRLITKGIDGGGANGESYSPVLSADGQFLAFSSLADDLVVGDENTVEDIFLYEITTGRTSRVSENESGVPAEGPSQAPAISGDGRLVAFQSISSNLIALDDNRKVDIFVKDISTARVFSPSLLGPETQREHDSLYPSISTDGTRVAFVSCGTAAPVEEARCGVFMYDAFSGSTSRVSENAYGEPGNGDSYAPSLSQSGDRLVFASEASNFGGGDANQNVAVYLSTFPSGTPLRIGDASTTQNGVSLGPVISRDGRYVAFWSSSTTLIPGDNNEASDIFITQIQSSQ